MEKIILEEVSGNTHIGFTEKERSKKQKLLVSIEVEPKAQYNMINDELGNTINYSAVRMDVKNLLKSGSFNLIETVAEKIALLIRKKYNIKNVTVCVKKFPYKDTKYVAYRLTI